MCLGDWVAWTTVAFNLTIASWHIWRSICQMREERARMEHWADTELAQMQQWAQRELEQLRRWARYGEEEDD